TGGTRRADRPDRGCGQCRRPAARARSRCTVTWAAVAAALASAFGYSVASVTQHREAGEVSTHDVGAPSLLLKLAVRPWWLAGALADLCGVGFQTLALGWGSVVLVQPLLVTGVAMA